MAEAQRKKFEEMAGFREVQSVESQLVEKQGELKKNSKKFSFNLIDIMVSLLSNVNDAIKILSEILEETILPFCVYMAIILIIIDLAFYSADVYKTSLRVITLIVLFSYVRGGTFFGGGKRR